MTKIDLSLTTVKYPLPDFIGASLSQYSTDSNSYHHQPDELRKKIAYKHQLPIDYIYLTAGADQAITLLSTLFGRSTHVFTPTYISYTDAKKLGGEITEHRALKDSTYEISSDYIEGASLIFIANPNNPAGFTKRDKIIELTINNPEAIVVVDEAYGDFFEESVVEDVKFYKNLIVLRSFSKGYSLAGFRIGYMVTQPEIQEQLVLESTWFNVAYTSVGAAITALNHEDYFDEMRQTIITERQKIEGHLKQFGYHVIPSQINAVLIKFEDEASASIFSEKLKGAEITVNLGNGASNCGLDKSFVRISIGTTEQMKVLRDTIAG